MDYSDVWSAGWASAELGLAVLASRPIYITNGLILNNLKTKKEKNDEKIYPLWRHINNDF